MTTTVSTEGSATRASRPRRRTRAPGGKTEPGRTRRVVVLSHGHPIESPAGGEIAAREEFLALAAESGTEAVLVAASANGLVPVGEIRPLDGGYGAASEPREYIVGFAPAPSWEGDVSRLSPPPEHLLDWLYGLAADEIRVHHFFRIGLEFLFALRIRLPQTRFVFVAHEMMTICEANGHMVKEFTRALCYRASPLECAWCFPKKGPGYFEEREAVMRGFLDLFDEVRAPSRFVCDRLIEWGVPAEKVRHAPLSLGDVPSRPWPAATPERPLILGFVGHVAPHKGVLLLLDAVETLPEAARERLRLRIHGILHPNMDQEFRRTFLDRVGGLRRWVSYEGAYAPERLPAVLSGLDGVVVPSLWWENAPMVMVEASRAGIPLVAADVGGMREIAEQRPGSRQFRLGSATDLARCIADLVLDAAPAAGAGRPN